MKKKMMLLLAAVCAVTMLGGCGTDKKNNADEKNSGDTETESEEKAEEIKYNVDDYVELGEYKGLKITLGSYDVTEEDVKSNIESMIASYPAYEDTDKDTVEEGDFVNIDYEGLKDGEAFDGGTAQGTILEIGSDSFIDGFEDGLIGVKVGEEVALDLTFPEDYQNTDLAGQAVVFNVTVNKIVNKIEMTYDTLTDDYVASNFAAQGYENVEDFKNGIKAQLESNNETTKNNDTQSAIFEKLAEVCKIKSLPEGLLEQKIDEYMEQFEANLETSYGMTLEDYLSNMNTTEEDFNAQVEQYMKESLENQLILEAIAKKEGIEADEEGFAEYKAGVVADYGYESEDALIEQYGEDYVRDVYINEKALEMITENAVITYGDEDGDAAASEDGDAAASEDGDAAASEDGDAAASEED